MFLGSIGRYRLQSASLLDLTLIDSAANLGNPKIADLFAERGPSLVDSIDIN